MAKLSNNGEVIALRSSVGGSLLHRFEYKIGGAWPNRPDGNGSSLEVIDPAGPYDNGANWQSSLAFNGTPGAAAVAAQGGVVINEVLTHTDAPDLDAIELHNPTANTIDVSGWYLSDTNNYQKFEIPGGTVIPAGGYMVFDESHFNENSSPTRFGLNGAHGDDVWLLRNQRYRPAHQIRRPSLLWCYSQWRNPGQMA